MINARYSFFSRFAVGFKLGSLRYNIAERILTAITLFCNETEVKSRKKSIQLNPIESASNYAPSTLKYDTHVSVSIHNLLTDTESHYADAIKAVTHQSVNFLYVLFDHECLNVSFFSIVVGRLIISISVQQLTR